MAEPAMNGNKTGLASCDNGLSSRGGLIHVRQLVAHRMMARIEQFGIARGDSLGRIIDVFGIFFSTSREGKLDTPNNSALNCRIRPTSR
jgi:hypothetical protein